MDKIKELLLQRANLISEARKIIDKAEGEGRDLNTEENTQYDAMFADAEKLQVRARRLEEQTKIEKEISEVRREPIKPDTRSASENAAANPGEARIAAFRKWLGYGMKTMSGDERRELQADSDPAGGYIVPPQQFVQTLIKAVDDMVFIRRMATVLTLTNAASLGQPELTNDPSDADWTSELATGGEDSTMDFGKREMKPNPLAKRIKVSNKLLRLGGGVEALVRERLAYKFGITEEKAFLTGHGAGQPLGVFTASAQGISTARDINTGNTTTAITLAGLQEAKYSLKQQYWNRAAWLFHRDGVKMISKLTDAVSGRPLWEPSIQVGQPDRLLSHPIMMSEYAPNTFTSGLYVGMFADFKQYQIVDALDMQLQRLVELYAEQNKTGFIGRMELDGAPVLEEAFARVTLA